MYFQQAEHNPPHIHAIYGDQVAAIAIVDGEILEGELPERMLLKVRKWISEHKTELMEIWRTQEFRKVKPLE